MNTLGPHLPVIHPMTGVVGCFSEIRGWDNKYGPQFLRPPGEIEITMERCRLGNVRLSRCSTRPRTKIHGTLHHVNGDDDDDDMRVQDRPGESHDGAYGIDDACRSAIRGTSRTKRTTMLLTTMSKRFSPWSRESRTRSLLYHNRIAHWSTHVRRSKTPEQRVNRYPTGRRQPRHVTRRKRCFLCRGPPVARECPDRNTEIGKWPEWWREEQNMGCRAVSMAAAFTILARP